MSTGPWITEERKKEILDLLEAPLKAGLSLTKACELKGIPRPTVSKLIGEGGVFGTKIAQFRSLQAEIISFAFHNRLVRISNAVNGEKKPDGTWKKEPRELTEEELEFLKWYSTHAQSTRGEFSDRQEVDFTDPQERIKEINKLLDEKFGTNE